MTARFLLHLRRWECQNTVATHQGDEEFGSIRFNQNPGQSQSSTLMGDFGEDPVRRAERDIEARLHAQGKGKARSIDPQVYEHEHDDRGEGPSSMV
jgi:hypothetical protein